MPSVTIRDLPPELHNRLKESAQRNRRSLNAEILWRLEKTPIEPVRQVSIEEIRERARKFRESLGFETTDEEIRRFKRQGRL